MFLPCEIEQLLILFLISNFLLLHSLAASPSEHTMEPGQVPTCVDDFERHAQMTLDRNARGYFASGADEEQTLAENRKAFKRYHIQQTKLENFDRSIWR